MPIQVEKTGLHNPLATPFLIGQIEGQKKRQKEWHKQGQKTQPKPQQKSLQKSPQNHTLKRLNKALHKPLKKPRQELLQGLLKQLRQQLLQRLRQQLPWLLAVACSSAAQAHETFAREHPAAAKLTFTVIIPSVLRVLENRHPEQLEDRPGPVSSAAAEQHLLLLSTLRSGFCAELGLLYGQRAAWQLQISQTSGSRGAWLEKTPAGYRLCAAKPGRYGLTLAHTFSWPEEIDADVDADAKHAYDSGDNHHRRHWPVSLSLSSP